MKQYTREVLKSTIERLKEQTVLLDDQEYIDLMGNVGDYCKSAETLTRMGKRPTS